jgi:hypothetical protein
MINTQFNVSIHSIIRRQKMKKKIFIILAAGVLLMAAVGTIYAAMLQEWGSKISNPSRFVLVLDNQAVLDRETGLVWERSPDPTKTDDWHSVINYCHQLEVGGRKGWHLPTIEQLASLVDTAQSNPTLTNGHPFINVQSSYWSTTQYAPVSAGIWVADFDDGMLYGAEGTPHAAWCVRGGQTEFTW